MWLDRGVVAKVLHWRSAGPESRVRFSPTALSTTAQEIGSLICNSVTKQHYSVWTC